jgi:hypothetical protein
MESDLAWAPTHTLINPLTEVVDHQQPVESSLPGRWEGFGRLTALNLG